MPSITVFISHNKADRDAARNIALFLAAENINVWFDEWEISAGDSIIKQINKGLLDCTHFIVLWSANSATSKWVRAELESMLSKAIETGNPRIIPVFLDDTLLPPLLQPLKYIRYHGGNEEDRTNIIESISGHKPSQDFIRAVVQKYNEVIYNPDLPGPFPFEACPSCGSKNLKGSGAMIRDDQWYIIQCEECGWGTASE
ncbi:MAG: toll/interleukin-1 receptor domain-containing protein [Chloroflexi bacterium]|nr:toll/interleukin-1 receptor domain-containing protein [Chloroflexota bacterium]MBL7061880.1 toll/interleukin-1 receptor domain-containing protein [Dehalococcoidia bacterium]